MSLMRGRVGINVHGAKLETPKMSATVTDALLLKQDRAGGDKPDQDRYQQRQRNQEGQGHQDEQKVQRALRMPALHFLKRKSAL